MRVAKGLMLYSCIKWIDFAQACVDFIDASEGYDFPQAFDVDEWLSTISCMGWKPQNGRAHAAMLH
jgi:hypothetical protein